MGDDDLETWTTVEEQLIKKYGARDFHLLVTPGGFIDVTRKSLVPVTLRISENEAILLSIRLLKLVSDIRGKRGDPPWLDIEIDLYIRKDLSKDH